MISKLLIFALTFTILSSLPVRAQWFTSPDLDCKVTTKNPAVNSSLHEGQTPTDPYFRSGSKIIKCETNGDGCTGHVEFKIGEKPIVITRSQSSVFLFAGTLNRYDVSRPLLGLVGGLPKYFRLVGSGFSMSCDLK